MTNHLPITKIQDGALLAVHATPKAAKNAIVPAKADAAGNLWLGVRVTTPPEDGKANKAVIKLLAKSLRIAPRNITLHSGETSRYKRFIIRIPYDDLATWLQKISPS